MHPLLAATALGCSLLPLPAHADCAPQAAAPPAAPRLIADVGEPTEGCAWVPEGARVPGLTGGALVFSGRDRIWVWDPASGAVRVFFSGLESNNGNAIGPDGLLRSCERGRHPRLVRWEAGPDGPTPVTAAEPSPAAPLRQPNDLAYDARGRLWFTDPDFSAVPDGWRFRETPRQHRVYRLDADGAEPLAMLTGLGLPNGLCFSEDGQMLFVGDSATGEVLRYELDPAGNPGRGRVIIRGLPDWYPDGMKCRGGLLFVAAGPAGVIVYDLEGSVRRHLTLPAQAHARNLCFGGPQGEWLYIAAGDQVWGVAAGDPP